MPQSKRALKHQLKVAERKVDDLESDKKKLNNEINNLRLKCEGLKLKVGESQEEVKELKKVLEREGLEIPLKEKKTCLSALRPRLNSLTRRFSRENVRQEEEKDSPRAFLLKPSFQGLCKVKFDKKDVCLRYVTLQEENIFKMYEEKDFLCRHVKDTFVFDRNTMMGTRKQDSSLWLVFFEGEEKNKKEKHLMIFMEDEEQLEFLQKILETLNKVPRSSEKEDPDC